MKKYMMILAGLFLLNVSGVNFCYAALQRWRLPTSPYESLVVEIQSSGQVSSYLDNFLNDHKQYTEEKKLEFALYILDELDSSHFDEATEYCSELCKEALDYFVREGILDLNLGGEILNRLHTTETIEHLFSKYDAEKLEQVIDSSHKILFRDPDIVDLLLSNGADPNFEIRSPSGNYTFPLHRHAESSESNAPKICKILLENGAKIDAKDFYGNTAFHAAVSASNFDVALDLVEHLLENLGYAKLQKYLMEKNNNGETAMDLIQDKLSDSDREKLMSFLNTTHETPKKPQEEVLSKNYASVLEGLIEKVKKIFNI